MAQKDDADQAAKLLHSFSARQRDAMKQYYDFHYIAPSHQDIHDRLRNWGRYYRNKHIGFVQPMFKQAKTSRQWDIDPHIHIETDVLSAEAMEQAVRKLVEGEKTALRWLYVKGGSATSKARDMGVQLGTLYLLVQEGRESIGFVLSK